MSKWETVTGDVHSGPQWALDKVLLMFLRQKKKKNPEVLLSGAGKAGMREGGQGRTCFLKCVDASTSVRQDRYLQGWATKLCLVYSFLKCNPNSCSEGAVIKVEGGTSLGGRHTTNDLSKI